MDTQEERRLINRLGEIEAHHRLVAALGIALIVFVAAWQVRLPVRIIIGWDAYAISLLTLAWARILGARPRVIVNLDDLTHINRKLIFLFVVVAACAGLMSIGLLGSAKGLEGPRLFLHVGMTLGTIALSWLVLHTIFALYYAYLYFRPCLRDGQPQPSGGLVFPTETCPDYTDFAYFSFIIGMTSQVSDVQISDREIRRWALLHGIFSFGFNTVVLALCINTASSML